MIDRDAAIAQLDRITEAMHTVAITKSLESKYELSMEILKLGEIMPLKPEKVMKMRQDFELTSLVWWKAEMDIIKLREGKNNE